MKKHLPIVICVLSIVALWFLYDAASSVPRYDHSTVHEIEGIVIDFAMDSYHKREARGYVGVQFDNGDGVCVYEPARRSNIIHKQDISLGDRVRLKVANDPVTNELVALDLTKLS